jgi:hypothetical protein
MFEFSDAALAALLLHNAQKSVSGRGDGAWWLLDFAKWEIISKLPLGPEHSFIVGVIHAYNVRRLAA